MELIGTPMDSIFKSKETDKCVRLFYDQSTQSEELNGLALAVLENGFELSFVLST